MKKQTGLIISMLVMLILILITGYSLLKVIEIIPSKKGSEQSEQK